MKDKMKEPNGKVWWIGAIVICLLLWGGVTTQHPHSIR